MQTTQEMGTISIAAGRGEAVLQGSARTRAQAHAERLSYRDRRGETLSELAHDARNMVMALELYCELLAEPGVLSPPCRHHAGELRLVTASCRRLVEKLSLMGKRETAGATLPGTRPVALSLEVPERPIQDLREEMLAMRSLLGALAGPAVAVMVTALEGALPVWLTAEDLTRVLVNLVKNSSEAMQGVAGRETGREVGVIDITLCERAASADAPQALVIAVADSGPGIDPSQLEAVFEPGFTTNAPGDSTSAAWPAAHRGLGLFICRSIVEAAGGKMRAGNRAGGGAHIEIELPVRTA